MIYLPKKISLEIIHHDRIDEDSCKLSTIRITSVYGLETANRVHIVGTKQRKSHIRTN